MELQIENPDIEVLVLVSCGAEGLLDGLGDVLDVLDLLAQGCVGSGGGAEGSGDWYKGGITKQNQEAARRTTY